MRDVERHRRAGSIGVRGFDRGEDVGVLGGAAAMPCGRARQEREDSVELEPLALDRLEQEAVAARHPDAEMEGRVMAHEGFVVIAGAGGRRDGEPEPVEIGRITPARGQGGGRRLDRRAERERLRDVGASRARLREQRRERGIPGGWAHYERPAVAPSTALDQAVRLQFAQRLLHRRTPDAEGARQLALGRQGVAAADQPQADVAADLLRDDLVGTRRVDALEGDAPERSGIGRR